MLILKINEVFLPSAISEKGRFYDHMESPYIGFCVEAIEELDWNQKPVKDSRFLGINFTIIEKATTDTAILYKGDFVAVSRQYLTQGLYGFTWDEWLSEPKIIMNNCDKPIMRHYKQP